MAVEHPGDVPWERLTVARVRILRELEDRRTEREIAERLLMTYNGVRSHVEDLKALTGCADVRALGRWWGDVRGDWLGWLAREAVIAR